MLAAVDVCLYPKADCELPHPCGHLLHAVLLQLVHQSNPDMAEQLHRNAQVKPFAISTLWPRSKKTGDKLEIPKYTACRWRIGMVTKPVFEAVSGPLFQILASNGEINIQGKEFTILEANMEPPYGGVSNFKDLLGDDGSIIALKFVSPTMFRRKGLGVPLPEPHLVYGSLWQRWCAFSDVPVDASIYDEMLSVLALREARIHTRVWKYPRFLMTGFVGLAVYELVKPVSKEARELFNALSQLSFYTGIGYRTTMGMGQCLPIDISSEVE
jgi:CRISPR-associated endoribonuclease Cas6